MQARDSASLSASSCLLNFHFSFVLAPHQLTASSTLNMKSSILIGVAITGWMRALPSVAAQGSTIEDVRLTFYSRPDNGPPPGPDNTFDCGRGKGLDGKPIAGGKSAVVLTTSSELSSIINGLARTQILLLLQRPPTTTTSHDVALSTFRFYASTSAMKTTAQIAVSNNHPSMEPPNPYHLPPLRPWYFYRVLITMRYLETDWDNHKLYHIGLWTSLNQESRGNHQISCENNLPGGSQTIIKNPPGNLAVDSMLSPPAEYSLLPYADPLH